MAAKATPASTAGRDRNSASSASPQGKGSSLGRKGRTRRTGGVRARRTRRR
jgi:hypothetical protein